MRSKGDAAFVYQDRVKHFRRHDAYDFAQLSEGFVQLAPCRPWVRNDVSDGDRDAVHKPDWDGYDCQSKQRDGLKYLHR